MNKFETRIPEENLRTGLTRRPDTTCPRAPVLNPPQAQSCNQSQLFTGPAEDMRQPRPSPPLPGRVSLTPLQPQGRGQRRPGPPQQPPPRARLLRRPRARTPRGDGLGLRPDRAGTRPRRPRHHYLSLGPGGRAAGAAGEARGNNGGGGAGACVASSAPRCGGGSGTAASLTRKARRVSARSRTFQPGPQKPGPELTAPRLHRDLASAPLRMCARGTLRAH